MQHRAAIAFRETFAGMVSTNRRGLQFQDLLPRDFLADELSIQKRQIRLELQARFECSSQQSSQETMQGELSGELIVENIGRLSVLKGRLTMFVKPEPSAIPDTSREQHYYLQLIDQYQNHYTLYAFKRLTAKLWWEAKQELGDLQCALFEGHCEEHLLYDQVPLLVGSASMNWWQVLDVPWSLHAKADRWWERLQQTSRLTSRYVRGLWRASVGSNRDLSEISFSLEPTATLPRIDIQTEDGLLLHLKESCQAVSQDVLVLIHDLGASSQMFMLPEQKNLLSFLQAHGYPHVFLLDWRGSQSLPYLDGSLSFDLDQVAAFDIAASMARIRQRLGSRTRLHIIAHGLGAIAVAAAIAGGRLDYLTSFSAFGVSFCPAKASALHLAVSMAPEQLESSAWTRHLLGAWPRLVPSAVDCRLENLHPLTHQRLHQLVTLSRSLTCDRHLAKMMRVEHLVPYEEDAPQRFALAEGYHASLRRQQLPALLLIGGRSSHLFQASQRKAYNYLKQMHPNSDVRLLEFDHYAFHDLIIGRRAWLDVFPAIIDFLDHARRFERNSEFATA